MEPWRTSIVDAADAHIRIRGYDVTELMGRVSFTDLVFLLHRSRLPNAAERKLLDAILIGVADHGSGAPSCAAARLAASGNRQSLSAAVAAGILTVGDEHGGAGSACMTMIGEVAERSRRENLSHAEAAKLEVAEARAQGRRLPGLGHRVHRVDPRTAVLFDQTRASGLAGDGIAVMEALRDALQAAGRELPINIDGALAAVLYDLGFQAEFGKLVFLIGRVAGLTAEVSEEYGREKPMRIKIPVTYDGVEPRTLD